VTGISGFPGFSGPRLSLAPATSSGLLDKTKPDTRSGHEINAPATYAAKESPIKGYLDSVKAQSKQGPKSTDQKMVEATGGTNLPPPRPPDTPAMAAFRAKRDNVWAPVEAGPPPETYGPKPKLPPAPRNASANPPKFA